MKANEVNYQATAEAVKAELLAAGVSLAGPCGAFEITKRVAARHAADGAGCLSKPSGNNCDGYSVDCIVFPDGSIADCLVDGGGANGPAWQVGEPVDPARWRPSPYQAPQEPPADPGEPPADPGSGETLGAILARLEAQLAALEAAVKAIPPCSVTVPPVTFPDYEGRLSIPFLGSSAVTLKPKGQ